MRFSKVHLEFGLAILSGIARGRLSFRGGHRPVAGHTVSNAFVGVGVAAAEDPAVDDYILERLREAGVRYVRLDFSPGDEEKSASRLLSRLIADELKVTLHLVQPFDDAKRMPAPDVSETWQRFVAKTLDRFGSAVEIVEAGSTTNRKRWAGHSIPGFLAMWEIVWREARARRVTLAGPSVTDFEPPWNIGLLALLRARGQLPDLHTNNLFSERSTEPERYDHKILGRAFASSLKFNLVKKARLLARIGADYGVPRLFSPSAFWTLPRIERMHPDSEQKQADYLVRYLVLAAASGALERAWWGPLICHREGLIDEGDFSYPRLERITHYAGVRGCLAGLRVRPALFALSSFTATIPGTRYVGRLNQSEGLEVHAFASATTLVHVVWTINGRAAALQDIYTDDDLRGATFRSRDGDILPERPSLVSESPLYLSWASAQVEVLTTSATLLPDVSIHRHIAERMHFYFREAGWRGIVLARDSSEAANLLEHIHPKRIGEPLRAASLRHARNAIWTIDDPRADDRKLVIKQPVRIALHKKFLDRFKPSKGLRSWSGTSELLRRGVSAAQPVAWFEKEADSSLTKNYYLCEYVQAEWTARDMIGAFAAGETSFAGVVENAAYNQLASYLGRMHGGGVLFRDLSGGNIMISRGSDGELAFSLIDTGRIRVFPRPLSLYQRFSDLVRICNKMHRDGRTTFLGIYLAALGKKLRWWHRWWFVAYDLKVVLKRRIGRKAWKQVTGGEV